MTELRTRRLTRQQISDFVPSDRGIRAFEDVQTDIIDQHTDIANASFLVVNAEPALGAERVIAPVSGQLSATDGGPNGSYSLGLADTTVTAGNYGDASHLVSITIDAKGRITAASQFALNSDNVTEGAANLFFTNARARAALSSGTGINYNSGSGIIAVGATLAAYAGGDTPSAFTLSIVDSVDAAAWRAAIGAGTSSTTGTVTSVNGSGGTTGLTLTGGPITTSGTLTLGGTLIAANGGTGLSTYTAGDIIYASGASTLAKLGIGSANKVLTSSGSAPQWTDTLVSLAGVFIGSSAALQGEKFNVIGGNGLLVRTQYAISSTAADIALGAGLLLLLRDNVSGGTALVLYENAQTPIIISQSGTKFVTAAPAGTQIQLADRASHLGVSAVMAAGQSSTLNVAVFSVDDA